MEEYDLPFQMQKSHRYRARSESLSAIRLGNTIFHEHRVRQRSFCFLRASRWNIATDSRRPLPVELLLQAFVHLFEVSRHLLFNTLEQFDILFADHLLQPREIRLSEKCRDILFCTLNAKCPRNVGNPPPLCLDKLALFQQPNEPFVHWRNERVQLTDEARHFGRNGRETVWCWDRQKCAANVDRGRSGNCRQHPAQESE